jgi:hypothetical protein
MEQELPLAEVAEQGGPSKPEAEHCATNEGYQAVDDATDWNGVLQSKQVVIGRISAACLDSYH